MRSCMPFAQIYTVDCHGKPNRKLVVNQPTRKVHDMYIMSYPDIVSKCIWKLSIVVLWVISYFVYMVPGATWILI